MRIAFVTFEFSSSPSGGAGTYAWNLTRALARLGHTVVVFSPISPNSSNMDLHASPQGLRIVHVRCSQPFRALQFWMKLPRVITSVEKEAPFDIVHFNGLSYGFIGRRLARAPNIVTIHHLVIDAIKATKTPVVSMLFHLDREENIVTATLERICLHSADSLIAVSEFTRRRIIEEYLDSGDRVHVIPNGTDANAGTVDNAELDRFRDQLGIRNRPVVLTVGRIDDPRKGLDQLISAFSKVREHVDAVLVIAGKGDQEQLRKQIHSLGLVDDVRILGFVDGATLRRCYSMASIYATASRLEGFGLTILDAMAVGNVIVATNAGAIPEIVESGENGILVAPYDTAAMADALVRVLRDPLLASQMARANMQKTTRHPGWQEIAKLVVAVYESNANKVSNSPK